MFRVCGTKECGATSLYRVDRFRSYLNILKVGMKGIGMKSPLRKWLSVNGSRKTQQKERKVPTESGNIKVINDLRDSMCLAEGRQTGEED